MPGPAMVRLESDTVRIEFDPRDGTVRQVENKISGLHLIHHPTGGSPWRIELDGQREWVAEHVAFDWSLEESTAGAPMLSLRWETAPGLVVEGRVELPPNQPNATFFVKVIGAGDHRVDKIEYPILRGIGALSDTADSFLAHPQGTGFLFRNPQNLFDASESLRAGMRYSLYPEGFSGSSMQFMAYYAADQGGFYLAAHDPAAGMKWLNFYKTADGALEASFMHQSPEVHAGKGLTVAYPILIGALSEGNWYEAAERYKAWAIQQSWTAQGTFAERTDTSNWLLEEVGFATFGVNAAFDRAAWLDRFHAITNEPVFHILGVNWLQKGGDYRNNHPGGRDDWFPARFSAANIETIQKNGDYWAPFEFDLLLDPNGIDGEEVSAALQQLPEEKYSFDPYRFPFVCPTTDYQRELHRWRDEHLAGTYGADALYYDISASNVLMTCRSPNHGHPIGGGGWMVEAFASMWAATKAAATAAKGAYVPQGAEMITDVFIPFLDYYQARAEASPLSVFEADKFRDWIRQGEVEKIPLFSYVYHEYGPVRLDGWAKLSPEVGELYYWVAARVALWGGLFELNYEFSPLETLDGVDEDPAEHYCDFKPRSHEIDPAKVAFVREVATARTGFAKPYLVYGTMVRPLDLDVTTIDLDYHLYNLSHHLPHYEESGTHRVSSVLHAAWRSPAGHLGFLFVNLNRDEEQTLTLQIDPTRYGLTAGQSYGVTRSTANGTEALATIMGRTTLPLALRPRQVTLLEFSH
ncbi:MAG: DUF6259 domain-containing protein [Thermomicrobiales bacterium]